MFQYLETFFECGIAYRVFAVAESCDIKTNSGYVLHTDDVVANLVGKEDGFDALVFACGDAVPVFAQYADEPYNRALLDVIGRFAAAGKILAGHCAAALMFDKAGVLGGAEVAVHPLAAAGIKGGTVSADDWAVDSLFYTARDEKCLYLVLPKLVEVLGK